MSAITPRLFAVTMILLLTGLPAWSEGSSRGKISRAGKAATVFVKGKAFNGQGSAFCIHPAGIFLTNEHVVSRENTFMLFLNGGTKEVKLLTAKVLRTDKALDLALLQVEGEKDLPALPLATDNNLSETDEVIAFGFPFGQRLSVEQKETPAISVNVGKVTSLREKDGELNRIQLDAALNPGNSGGPVLNEDGKVVGVAVSGVPGAGVNFAIPINHVRRFLARPELLFMPPVLTLSNVHEPAVFQVQALTFGISSPALDMEFILKTEGKQVRSFKMERTDDSYRVRAVPLPRPRGVDVFRLTAHYARGSVSAEVEDQTFKVGDTAVQLHEVRRIVASPDPRVWLRDGKLLRGALSGIEEVAAQLGSARVNLDLSRAADVRLQPAADLETLEATIVARRGKEEVGRMTRPLSLQDAPQLGEEDFFLDLRPAPLEKGVVEYPLDAAIADVAVGGGGRYLILHLPKLRQLAVFDVNQAKVVKRLPLPDGPVKFAAGLEQLIVALPVSRTLQRWNLTTLEQERTAPYPFQGDILAFALGSASQGPLFVIGKEENKGPERGHQPQVITISAVTLDDLKRREMAWSKSGHQITFPTENLQNLHLRASADGKSMGLWSTGISFSGITWIHCEYPIARSEYLHRSCGHVVPGPTGKVLFTGFGMFSHSGFSSTSHRSNPSHPRILPEGTSSMSHHYPGSNPSGRYLPAHHGDYYLYLGAAPSPSDRNPPRVFEIHKLGLEKPLLSLSDSDILNAEGGGMKADFTMDKRFHLIPKAKVLIVIPPSDDRLILHRIDVEAALRKMKEEKK
ncbi:MAG TPA: serine protease [Gemmataceae bacterium]